MLPRNRASSSRLIKEFRTGHSMLMLSIEVRSPLCLGLLLFLNPSLTIISVICWTSVVKESCDYSCEPQDFFLLILFILISFENMFSFVFKGIS